MADDKMVNSPEPAEGLGQDLDTAAWLSGHAESLDPRPGFLESNRAYVLEEIHKKNRRDNRTIPRLKILQDALVFSLVLAIFLTGGVLSVFSENAQPSNPLYPLRYVNEKIQLTTTMDAAEEVTLQLRFAQGHLVAYANMISQGRSEDAKAALRYYDWHLAGAARTINEITDDHLEADRLVAEFDRLLIEDTVIIAKLAADNGAY